MSKTPFLMLLKIKVKDEYYYLKWAIFNKILQEGWVIDSVRYGILYAI